MIPVVSEFQETATEGLVLVVFITRTRCNKWHFDLVVFLRVFPILRDYVSILRLGEYIF